MSTLDRNVDVKDKKLIILRGLPGSGKSEDAKRLVGNGIIHSTDNYFIRKGMYVFNSKYVGRFHYLNLISSIVSMKRGISPIIIDNTNILAADCESYVEMGKRYGYDIVVVEPGSPWAFDIEELMKRNAHGITRETLVEMSEQYESPEVFKKKLGL